MMESNTPTLYIPLVGVVCRISPSSVEEVPKESLQISAKKPESALPGCGSLSFLRLVHDWVSKVNLSE